MSQYPESTRICSLFAGPTRTGGTYYSGKLGGAEPVVIVPGQRVSLVKTLKTAINRSTYGWWGRSRSAPRSMVPRVSQTRLPSSALMGSTSSDQTSARCCELRTCHS